MAGTRFSSHSRPLITSVAVAKKPASSGTFSDDEREAMKERAREVKSARSRGGKADGEDEVLAKIVLEAAGV